MLSGNLSLREERCDLDYLIALGVAAQRVSGAAEILHLGLVASPDTWRAANAATINIVRKLSCRHGWNLRNAAIQRIAGAALRQYAVPVCPKCAGRRYEVIPGTPTLSTRPCTKCRGTGIRPIPVRDGRRIAMTLAALERIEFAASAEIKRVLHGKDKLDTIRET